MIEYLFAQYATYSTLDIVLEITAVIFGLFSVWYAKKDNILVFPTGLVSTFIYAYLLWQWSLLGDSMINVYYFIMTLVWVVACCIVTTHEILAELRKPKKEKAENRIESLPGWGVEIGDDFVTFHRYKRIYIESKYRLILERVKSKRSRKHR